MPNHFQLLDRETGKPAVLQTVDDEMREHFGAEPSKTEWYYSWYDLVGYALAVGHDFDWCREHLYQPGDEPANERSTRGQEIIDYLDERYTTRAWYAPRRS